MLGRIEHRGPDGQGHKGGDTWALGHNHLYIRGKQVQPCSQSGLTGVLNGQIYNLVEDAREVTQAYVDKGPACLDDFEGMFAIAIYGPDGLFLARDRLGVKPLYYAEVNGSFYFASELKAFIDVLDLKIDDEIVEFSRRFPQTSEGSEETIFHPVKRLLPGHYLTFDGTTRITRWWRPIEHRPDRFEPEEFVERFKQAIKVREVSDRPMAIALSGGLDSSCIYALSSVRRSYVAMYGENQEQANALKMAPDSVLVPIKKCDLDVLAYIYEDVTKLYPGQCQLYRKMSVDVIRVSLEGHGPDEMFGGYKVAQKYFDGHKFVPQHDAAGIFAQDVLRSAAVDSEDLRSRIHGLRN